MDELKPFHSIGTRFVRPPEELQHRASRIRAVLFDWDGVFNNGFKDADGGSPFSEVGSMGVNLLRFALWLQNDALPFAAVITGQHNVFAEKFAQREKLHGVYMGFTNKPEAFEQFLATHDLKPEEVAFFFDDVLDLPVAAVCGLRVMIGRKDGVWFTEEVVMRGEVDVVTATDGGANGLREACDLMVALLGRGPEVIEQRVRYSEVYQRYLAERQVVLPTVQRKER